MKEKLQQRLQQLKAEYKVDQEVLAELESKQTNLRNTLLRIDGAIQVLEEVLSESNTSDTLGNGVISAEPMNAEVV
ncbi:MAG TPA: hypothetical protein VIQ31_38540 [Phormidium sp.]